MRCVLFLSTALLLPLLAAASPLPDAPHIYVHGEGEVEFPPERARIHTYFSAAADDADEARRLLAERIGALLARLRAEGIDDKDIAASSVSIDPDYKRLDGERVRTGVEARRGVNVTVRDMSRYSDTALAVNASGPNSMHTDFTGSAPAQLAEAQRRAVADARDRAEMLAGALGVRLGRIHSLSEFELRQEERYGLRPSTELDDGSVRYFADVASPAPQETDFLPGMITARATVYVVYLLEDEP